MFFSQTVWMNDIRDYLCPWGMYLDTFSFVIWNVVWISLCWTNCLDDIQDFWSDMMMEGIFGSSRTWEWACCAVAGVGEDKACFFFPSTSTTQCFLGKNIRRVSCNWVVKKETPPRNLSRLKKSSVNEDEAFWMQKSSTRPTLNIYILISMRSLVNIFPNLTDGQIQCFISAVEFSLLANIFDLRYPDTNMSQRDKSPDLVVLRFYSLESALEIMSLFLWLCNMG